MRRIVLTGFALLVGLTVAGPGVGSSTGLGGPAVTAGKAPWISSTADFVVENAAGTASDAVLLKSITTVPANQTLLLGQFEIGKLRTLENPCDKLPNGSLMDIWPSSALSSMGAAYGCLVIDGIDVHCAYGTVPGYNSRWGAVSASVEFPTPGLAIPAGATVGVRVATGGNGGKCRYYATVIGTLIAN